MSKRTRNADQGQKLGIQQARRVRSLVDVLAFTEPPRAIHDIYIRTCVFAKWWALCPRHHYQFVGSVSGWTDVSLSFHIAVWISLQRGTYQLQVMDRLLGPGRGICRFYSQTPSTNCLASVPLAR